MHRNSEVRKNVLIAILNYEIQQLLRLGDQGVSAAAQKHTAVRDLHEELFSVNVSPVGLRESEAF